MKRLNFFLPLLTLSLFAQPWTPMEAVLTGSGNSLSSGTGHSWGDFDGDGDYDLFLNGSQRLWINKALENNTFVSGQNLLPPLNGGGWAACFGDFDNDGKADIHCGNSGVDFLLENRFPEPFVSVATAYSLRDPDWNQSVNWADYNNDGWLDIYITHEVPGGLFGPHQFYENAYPKAFIPRFPTVNGQVDSFGLADKNSHAYGLSWADFDLDGDLDMITSACGGANTIPNEEPHNKIYRNKHPEMGFEDMALATGLVTPAEVQNGSDAYWGTLFDYNGDEFPDLFIGDNGGNHRIWRNTARGPGEFGVQLVDGLVHNLAGGGAFLRGACAGDYDNDGDLDLYTTASGLYENNGDGSFTARTNLVNGSGSDASFVDYDMDGHLDIFNFGDLYRNPGGYGNNWIAIDLEGNPNRGTTRSAHHVKIRVTAGELVLYREHRFMVGSYSQHMLPTHFGLGQAGSVDEIRITWTNGDVDFYNDVAVNQYINFSQAFDCSGTLQASQELLLFCSGDTVQLSAGSDVDLYVEWQVIEGPDKSEDQFSDKTSLQTDFTPASPGAYTIGISYMGCVEVVQLEVRDTDYDGDGVYDMDDLMESQAFWGANGDIGPYDLDLDGRASVLDMLNSCFFQQLGGLTLAKR